MRFLILGSSKMIGHVVALYLKEQGHSVCGFDDKPFEGIETVEGDIHDLDKLKSVIFNDKFDAVVNCLAIINQYAEADKAEATFINAFIPHYLEKITEGTDTVIVHRSTDCIFSGKKGGYTLSDAPDASSFYARTKAIGELINNKDISIRTSIVGPETDEKGESLLNWFINQQGSVTGFTGAIWTGVTTLEYAKIIEKLVAQKAHGIMQCVPNGAISKYELLTIFKKHFEKDIIIESMEGTKCDKSLCPETNGYNLDIPDYDEMIKQLAEWTKKHSSLYKGYFKEEWRK